MLKTEAEPRTSPTIYMIERDIDAIDDMLGPVSRSSPGARLLEKEIRRAVVLDDHECPEEVVRLNSFVAYMDERTDQMRRVRVVTPGAADIDKGWISILTPVGASLIGLTVGASLAWSDERGKVHSIRVVDVVNEYDPACC